MLNRYCRSLIVVVLSILLAGCLDGETQTSVPVENAEPTATPVKTASKSFTVADVAKLKWIEGTWRGMDGEKPFFERYRLEENALVVETLTDETLSKVEDSGRFELKDGEFGKGEGDKRSA